MSAYTHTRQVANLIPYKWVGKHIELFLQRRCSKAKIRPNLLGLWGGGIGTKVPLNGLLDELVQELQYRPDTAELDFIGEFNDEVPTHKHVYIQEVQDNFEDKIKISEGTGGEWVAYKDIGKNEDISPKEKKILYAAHKEARRKVAIQ